MQVVVDGSMFHGGVFSGNAIVMAAAEAVLDELLARGESIYRHMYSVSDELCRGVGDILNSRKVPHLLQNVGPMISIYLTNGPVDGIHEYRDVRRHCDFAKYIRLQHMMQRSWAFIITRTNSSPSSSRPPTRERTSPPSSIASNRR